MGPRGVQLIATGAAGALSLSAAIFYRALWSASPARLEEINEEHGAHRELPDLDEALVAAGALKVAAYCAMITLVAFLTAGRMGVSWKALAAGGGTALATLATIECIAILGVSHHRGRTLYRLISVVRAFSSAGGAVEWAGVSVGGFLARLAGREEPPAPEEAAEEEMLDAVSEGERQGVIEDQEREMIESIIEFKDVEVSEIMTPRTELTTVSTDMKLREALEITLKSGHSRLPVLSENADNIVGMLYAKDMLQHIGTPESVELSVRGVMREPYFVPETNRVRELLQDFRATNIHMAIVLDEYGGTSGIVTIEDIIEEIVGEIEDEYDEHEPPEISPEGRGQIVVAGHASVGDVNDALDTKISEEEEYETIAGYVLFKTGRIPQTGERFEWDGVAFEILEAEERRIKRMRVERVAAREATGKAGSTLR